jgi:hypothetical protein
MEVALPPIKLSALAMDLGMLPRESDNVLAKDRFASGIVNRLPPPDSPPRRISPLPGVFGAG